MYLLNRPADIHIFTVYAYLHSTMYLLNQLRIPRLPDLLGFTFHYVSIKSVAQRSAPTAEPDLHSTMYLLNHSCVIVVSSAGKLFTFHYVSIKSALSFPKCQHPQKYLHSTMYLLNQ